MPESPVGVGVACGRHSHSQGATRRQVYPDAQGQMAAVPVQVAAATEVV